MVTEELISSTGLGYARARARGSRYLVWSGGSVHGGYVYNARFIVQSNDRSPRYLDGRVESFIAGFREVRERVSFFF